MKESEDTSKWNDNLCSWIRMINTVKYQYYSKPSIDTMQPLLKHPIIVFTVETEIAAEKTILKFV